MTDLERLAAENARLKAVLSKRGFKITYKSTGELKSIRAPRRPVEKHTAVYWAKKRGYKSSMGLVRKLTKNKAIGLRKFKNMVERAELLRDTRAFLYSNGYDVPEKFFKKVPTYVLKSNDFYENVNAVLNSTAESEASELTPEVIQHSISMSVGRIKKANRRVKAAKLR